jgi:hypothetical protein
MEISANIKTESGLEKFLDVDISAGEAQILGWEG